MDETIYHLDLFELGSRHDSNGATNVNYAIGNMNGSDSAQTLTGKDIFSTETYKAVTTDQRKLLDSFDEILAAKIGIKQSILLKELTELPNQDIIF